MIINDSLKEFLQPILNKPIERISLEDLSAIKTVRISTSNSEGKHVYNLQDLQYFKSMEKVIISNSLVKESEIKILLNIPTLRSIEFEHCVFEDEIIISKLNHLQSLSFDNCFMRNYSFLNNMTNLIEFIIKNPYDETELDLNLLNNKLLLKILHLECCILTNFNALALPSLEDLFLLKTSLDDLSFIDNCPKLSNMYIEERYIDNQIVKNNAERVVFKTDALDLVTVEDSLFTL